MTGLAPTLAALARALGRINEAIGNAGRNGAGALLVVMTIVIMIQIVSRYIFNNSISWSEELSKSLMVWTAFLVAPWAYRHGANVSIDLFVEATPRRLQALIQILITVLVIWIVGIFLGESFALVGRGMQSGSATLPVPTGYFYAVIPVSLSAMLLVGAETLLRNVAEFVTGAPDPEAPQRRSRQEA